MMLGRCPRPRLRLCLKNPPGASRPLDPAESKSRLRRHDLLKDILYRNKNSAMRSIAMMGFPKGSFPFGGVCGSAPA